MEDVPHPKINPEVKSLGLKDSHFLSKKDLVTKPTTKTSEKELTPTKSIREVKLEKTKDTESLGFFDASQSTQ